MDIGALFQFNVSPLELIVRGTVMYWFLFLMFRFVMRRDAGSVGIADILLVVLIADASQNAMGGRYDTVAEGCLLVATLIGWNHLLDWGSYRFEAVRRFAEPAPLLLIDRGRVLGRNLKRELVTRDELDQQLRQHGVTSIADVRKAYMESDGKFSVITYEPNDKQPPAPRAPGA
ncbi:MAG: DUF421 domain-containing protein [Rhizobiales bacterium]|nr:DUF421 domain-containing protein [Rhizobacter sp.]